MSIEPIDHFNPDTQFAQAIREVARISLGAAEPKVIQIPVTDGAPDSSEKLSMPALVVVDPSGRQQLQPMVQPIREGNELARSERLRAAPGPDRREGTAVHQALESFIAHANRFKAENSAIWANAQKRELVSVLDYHPAGAESPARWGKHRGIYACPLSEAWKAWGGGEALNLDQDAFAALLDSRDRELFDGEFPGTKKPAPTPAQLISIATSLETYSTATAKRERDPNTGRVKISFSEDKGVAGAVMPPPAFLILIPVFEDAAPVALEVRLRVSVEGGHARFAVQIHAARDVLRIAFDELCQRVASETSLPIFVGTPE